MIRILDVRDLIIQPFLPLIREFQVGLAHQHVFGWRFSVSRPSVKHTAALNAQRAHVYVFVLFLSLDVPLVYLVVTPLCLDLVGSKIVEDVQPRPDQKYQTIV